MENRKRRFDEPEFVETIHAALDRVIGRWSIDQVHVFTPAADIPDDWALRLVVLPPSRAWSRSGPNAARDVAEVILRMRGAQPRQKQNRLLFLAADADQVMQLKDTARALLAWRSIEADIRDLRLNLDGLQSRQASQNREQMGETLSRLVREAFKCLIAPSQSVKSDGTLGEIEWQMFPLNPATQGLGKEMDLVLAENELVIREWAPIHLANLLKRWFWKDGVADVAVLDVRQKTCQYLYFPWLANSQVMQAAVGAGAASRDFFGLAYGREGDDYRGFTFGKNTSVMLHAALLLIEPSRVVAYEERTRPALVDPARPSVDPVPSVGPTTSVTAARAAAMPTHYYATVELDPVKATLQFSKIMSELVELFSANVGTKAQIRVDIEVDDSRGFNENTVRAAKENGKTLGMKTSDFV